MRIRTSGRPHKKISKKQCISAVRFCCNLLMKPRILEELNILVKFMEFSKEEEGALGFCDYEESDGRPRDFTIQVGNNLSKRMTLRTICHETVHIKQFSTGELKHLKRANRMTFKGLVIEDEIHYYDCAYEIEAAGREEGLYKRFITYYSKGI